MGHLPKGPATKMGMTEPLSYAAVIREKMEGEPRRSSTPSSRT